MDHKYYVFYKPYNVLNQFTKEREDHVRRKLKYHVEKKNESVLLQNTNHFMQKFIQNLE